MLVLAIAGCGGGGGSVEIPTEASAKCGSLLDAFDRIQKDMLPSQVVEAVGCEPYGQSENNGLIIYVQFQHDDFACANECLGVSFDFSYGDKKQGGAKSKVYSNHKLAKSDDFGYIESLQ